MIWCTFTNFYPNSAPFGCSFACKKPDSSAGQIRFLCVMQALPVMHGDHARVERIAPPITALLHHLSLVYKLSRKTLYTENC